MKPVENGNLDRRDFLRLSGGALAASAAVAAGIEPQAGRAATVLASESRRLPMADEDKVIRVTVWNEGIHEKLNREVAKLYPEGMHGVIAGHLNAQQGIKARTATLKEPEHGLTDKVLSETDVLIWWGHIAHHEVRDEKVAKVRQRVIQGMGLICLHSAHYSKIFISLMGTSCNLKWREAGEREILWVTKPGHPIVEGIDDHIVLEKTEMYGEHFDIPEPDEQIFISSFAGGEVFRSGCAWQRGAGRIFYFRPGHETYPIFHNPQVLRVITNAVRWAAPRPTPVQTYGHRPEIGWWAKK
jgi:trehalose utilization protein